MQDTEAPSSKTTMLPAGAGDPSRMLGGFIRAQRQMANLSLRQLSALTAGNYVGDTGAKS